MGSLTVRKKVVPLDVPVTKFGNTAPADGGQFTIASVMLDGSPAVTSAVQDAFARGQFQQLSDADKISAPAFEQFGCGVQIGDPSVKGGHDAPRTAAMQWRYVPDPTKASVLDRFAALSPQMFGACVQMGAGALSMVNNTGLATYTGPGTTSILATGPVSYVVTGTGDMWSGRTSARRAAPPTTRRARHWPATWRPARRRPASFRSCPPTRCRKGRRHERGRSGGTPGAKYHFRSWLRRGIGADAGQPDGHGLPTALRLTSP